MTHCLPNRQYSLLTALRMLLVVVALLNFATAAAQHDHQGAGAEGLCAICVYGSSSGARYPRFRRSSHSFSRAQSPPFNLLLRRFCAHA